MIDGIPLEVIAIEMHAEVIALHRIIGDVARWIPQDACLDINTWDALRPHRAPTERHG